MVQKRTSVRDWRFPIRRVLVSLVRLPYIAQFCKYEYIHTHCFSLSTKIHPCRFRVHPCRGFMQALSPVIVMRHIGRTRGI